MNTLRRPFAWTFLLAIATDTVSGQFSFPETSGPYVSGVYDFEFARERRGDDDVDVDDEGDYPRRIMARIWYPACTKDDVVTAVLDSETNATNALCGGVDGVDLGRLRLYFEPNEQGTITGVPTGNFPWLDALSRTELQSYLNAPPLVMMMNSTTTTTSSYPLIIHSHGALGWVSDTQALILEDLASQGIVVVAMTHPGGAAGVLYPNGDAVSSTGAFRTGVQQNFETFVPPIASTDIGTSYRSIQRWLGLGRGTTRYTSQWSNDQKALLDYLTNLTVVDEELSDGNATGFLATIVDQVDFERVAFVGSAFGAAASTLSAVRDDRFECVVDFDWWGQSMETFNNDLGVPLLLFTTVYTGRTTNFFFEDLDTLGSDPDIRRIFIPNATHLDFTDFVFSPASFRSVLGNYPVGSGTIDGRFFQQVVLTETLRFLSECIGGIPNATLEGLSDPPPGAAVEVDVTDVAEWWANYSPPTSTPTTAPAMMSSPTDAPTTSPTPSPEDDGGPTTTDSPSAGAYDKYCVGLGRSLTALVSAALQQQRAYRVLQCFVWI